MDIHVDLLTGLPDRRFFWQLVDEKLAEHSEGACMLTMNIEHFSYYNKWYGRQEGDKLLAEIAAFLQQCCRDMGVVAGYMGDDVFSVFFYSSAVDVAEKVRQGIIAIMQTVRDNEIFRPIFGGFVLKKGMEAGAIDLFDYTVNAIGQAVDSLNTGIYWFDEQMARQLIEEMELMPKITSGMEKAQFTFYLQPKCQIRDGRIVGAEALMRWISDTGEVIPPDRFIPALEKNGYIIQLDRYIWEKACQVICRWMEQGRRILPISVNISRIDIMEMDVVEVFGQLLDKYKIPVEYLELEITESAYAAKEALIKEAEKGLRKLGFKILIDDFGSGYSSLNMLKDIQADVLKLDMRFLDMNKDNYLKGRNIVSSVITMANQIDLPVIAEGVETLEQSEMLLSLGCSFAQGYYYYRPMPIAEYEFLLEDENNVAASNITSRKSGAAYLRDLAQYFGMVAEVNPFTGEYHVIHHDDNFRLSFGRRPDTITEYIEESVSEGCVHADDVAGYLRRSSLSYVKERLLGKRLRILYDLRYRRNGVYKWYTFECQQPKSFSLDSPWVLFTWKRANEEASERIDALMLMHNIFRKVIRVNLRSGCFDVLKKDKDEQPGLYRDARNIVDYATAFARRFVHPDDRTTFEWFVEQRRVLQHFRDTDGEPLRMNFRHKTAEGYRDCQIEIYRSVEYSASKPVLLVTIRDLYKL